MRQEADLSAYEALHEAVEKDGGAKGRAVYAGLFRAMLGLIRAHGVGSVLEVGCGVGAQTLTVADQLCGVPALTVRDILGEQTITRIPMAPREIGLSRYSKMRGSWPAARIAASAHWIEATADAPPIGVVAENRRSGMPKLVMKSSATAP